MDARYATWLERAVDSGAAALLAVAVAYAAVSWGSAPAVAGAAGLLALATALLTLRSITAAAPRFRLAEFEPQPLPAPEEVDELLLTEADRLHHAQADGRAGEPLPDDVVAELEDLSRVVRLFDRSAMPTPEQMKARVDRHLGESRGSAADASQALHDALSELRRTLR